MEMIRDLSGDDIEEVSIFDKFKLQKKDNIKYSIAYRFKFTPNHTERSASKFREDCLVIMEKIRLSIDNNFNVTMR
mgnify:CR=1 FL=1|jgi:phenylalanyl-tRNA synthetase beta subunit